MIPRRAGAVQAAQYSLRLGARERTVRLLDGGRRFALDREKQTDGPDVTARTIDGDDGLTVETDRASFAQAAKWFECGIAPVQAEGQNVKLREGRGHDRAREAARAARRLRD